MACTSVLSRFSKPEDVQGLQASPHLEEALRLRVGLAPSPPPPRWCSSLTQSGSRLTALRAWSCWPAPGMR